MGELRFLDQVLGRLGLVMPGTLGGENDIRAWLELISRAAWLSVSETKLLVPLENTAAIEEAFKRSLCRHLERTSRCVFGSRNTDGRVTDQIVMRIGDLSQILDRYPGLAWLWNRQLRGWTAFVRAFVRHGNIFTKSRSHRLSIRRIEADLSDPHRNGRTVIRVGLSDNSVWYYKPRSGRQEAAWEQFVNTLNEAGFVPALCAAKVKAYRDHCWMKGASPGAWGNDHSREKFAQGVGALLYLAHAFRAVDLHADNIVDCGAHPVLVDCESFFHPETKLPRHVHAEAETSLSRTGMFASKGGTIGGTIRPATERGCPQGPWMRTTNNERSKENVIRGFQAMHQFLRSQKNNRTIKVARDRLQRLPTRYIYRPTTYYLRLLHTSLAPGMMTHLQRRRSFLYAHLNDGLCSRGIVRAEVSQLLTADIPIFRGQPASPRRGLTSVQFDQALRELHSF